MRLWNNFLHCIEDIQSSFNVIMLSIDRVRPIDHAEGCRWLLCKMDYGARMFLLHDVSQKLIIKNISFVESDVLAMLAFEYFYPLIHVCYWDGRGGSN